MTTETPLLRLLILVSELAAELTAAAGWADNCLLMTLGKALPTNLDVMVKNKDNKAVSRQALASHDDGEVHKQLSRAKQFSVS